MKPKFRDYYEEDIDEGLSLLKHFSDVAKKYGRDEQAQLITDRMMGFLDRYYQ